MNPGLPVGGRKGLAGLVAAGASAVLLAWVLAVIFALPLTTGPVDAEAGRQVVERQLGPGKIARADSYRSTQRWIAIGSIAIEIGLLALFTFWRPATARRVLGRLGSRPVPGAAAIGAALALALALAAVPLGLVALERGRDFGLVNQGPGGWLRDWAMTTGISILLAAAGAAIAMFMWRRLRGRFWVAASVLAAAYAIIFVWLWPVVVSPLFNRFEPLPPGSVRDDVVRLADRSGVHVGQVLEVNASRRSTTLNAYVDGIGGTRRVVLYDNALRDLDRTELRSLIAHELTHVNSHDLRRGLLYAILVIPLGALTLQMAAGGAVRRAGDDPAGPGVIPALALALAVITLVLNVPGNWLSRRIEANADAGAIALTGSRGLVGLQLDLARRNLSDPDPPAAWQFLFGTHPTTVQRIGMAEAMKGGRK